MSGRFSNLKSLQLEADTAETSKEQETQATDALQPQPQPPLSPSAPGITSEDSITSTTMHDPQPQSSLAGQQAIEPATSGTAGGRPSSAPTPTAPHDSPPTRALRPWEVATVPSEPQKALNGRVPRSVRLAFDHKLTDAMDTLRSDVTVDIAVEALARLVTEDEDVYERWIHKIWELKAH